LTPDDILSGMPVDGPVVIYDDDHYYMGNVLAAHLAAQGHAVHLVCPLPSIAEWMGYTLETPRVMEEMIQLGIETYPNTTAQRWTGSSLEVVRSDTGGAMPAIDGKTLITVGARLPKDDLLRALKSDDTLADRVRGIGDCLAPGIIQAAVFSGHSAARTLIGDSQPHGLYRRETPVLFDR
jgi:dimethylamine/trimethylamine dehydrogenase